MLTGTQALPDELTHHPQARFVFYALVALLLAIAIGHLYLIASLTDRYLGLPLWVWVELVVVFVMVGIAWIAVQLVAEATDGGP